MEIVKAVEKIGLVICKGLIVIGDIFVDSVEKIVKIKKEFFEVLVCEMEGAVIG